MKNIIKKSKLKFYICLVVACISFTEHYSNKLKLEEVSNIETSSSFNYSNDTTFTKKYNLLLKKYTEKKYVEVLNETLDFSNQVVNKDSLTLVYVLIADIYDKTNNHSKAIDYYKKTILLYEGLNDNNSNQFKVSDLYAKILLRIGSSFQRISEKDSAKYYYFKLENLPSINNDLLNYKAVSFSNLSGIFERDSLYDKAKEYAEKAITIHKERKDKTGEASAINNLANIYLSLKDYEKAKQLYLEGVALIKNDNSANAVRFKASLYYNLAWAMRNLKEYEAYDYQELSYEIEDDIRDKEVKRMVEEVTAKFNVDAVKKQEENKRLRAKKTFWIIGISAFILILSLLYWLNFYKLKQKNLGLKLTQTQLIQSQKIERLKSESQTRILNATIDGKESERKQIAETLHDSVSALLSSAKLHLQATKGQFNGKTPIEIEKTSEIITEASQKIRDLSHTLVSSVLLKFGLEFAIKDMAKKYSNSQIEFDVDITNVRRYHQNFEIKMYNIVQEFLNNILKHSKASKATITLKEEEDKLHLEIVDNGVGFDKTKISQKDGLGINQIDARIKVMNGYFFIDSSKNNGTKIIVELPIIEKQKANLV